MAAPRKPSYWEYIKVEDLLTLQTGVESEEGLLSDDEVRFIVIHQIDELWFKLVLRELVRGRDLFRRERVPETSLASAATSLRRIVLVFQLAGDHFRLMETMRTTDYLAFRDKLSPASGFQSAQMREIEILLGLDPTERVPLGHEHSYLQALQASDGPSPAAARVERRIADLPSFKDALDAWLLRTPIDGSKPGDVGDDATVTAFLDDFLCGHGRMLARQREFSTNLQALAPADHARLQERYDAELADARAFLGAEDIADPTARVRTRRLRAAILFIHTHRQLPLLSWPGEILDAVLEAEQAMLIFRQRHARMVERVIGRRVGTGGSAGVDYLDQTALRYRIFKEIWRTRTLLLDPDLAPKPRAPEYYALREQ